MVPAAVHPNHRVWTANRGWSTLATSPAMTGRASLRTRRDQQPTGAFQRRALDAARAVRSRKVIELPQKWDEEFAHYLGWLVGDGASRTRTRSRYTHRVRPRRGHDQASAGPFAWTLGFALNPGDRAKPCAGHASSRSDSVPYTVTAFWSVTHPSPTSHPSSGRTPRPTSAKLDHLRRSNGRGSIQRPLWNAPVGC